MILLLLPFSSMANQGSHREVFPGTLKLPDDITASLKPYIDSPNSLISVDIRIGVENSLSPAYSGQPVSTEAKFSINQINQCLARADKEQLLPGGMGNTQWLLLTPGHSNGHALSGFLLHHGLLFRIDCPHAPTAPSLAQWPQPTATRTASSHNARLISVHGMPPVSTTSPLPRFMAALPALQYFT